MPSGRGARRPSSRLHRLSRRKSSLEPRAGRTPSRNRRPTWSQGRDHNQYGFSVWMPARAQARISYGSTDEVGWKAVEHPVHWHDFHATVLHILGIDHERLTFYHNGINRRLTNVHGKVIREILA